MKALWLSLPMAALVAAGAEFADEGDYVVKVTVTGMH